MTRLIFQEIISAPAEQVHRNVVDPDRYRVWAAEFIQGAYFEGSWEVGARIRFLSPQGDGMVSEIAEHVPASRISIRHRGYVVKGVDDTDSAEVRSWAPAYENYRFEPDPDGTRLTVEVDTTAEYEAHMAESWPRALKALKGLCEAPHSAWSSPR